MNRFLDGMKKIGAFLKRCALKHWANYYAKHPESVDNFLRLWVYFRPYHKAIIFSLVCALIVSAATGATGYLLKPVMDKIFIGQDKTFYYLMPWVIIVLFTVKGIFRFLQNYFLRAVGERVIRRIRGHLYKHYQYLDAAYYTDTNVGVMMSRITNDVNMMQRAVPSMVSLFQEPMKIFFLAIVAFIMAWKLSILIFIVFPLAVWPISYLGKKIRKWVRRGQERMGTLNTTLKETFSGVRIIKAFGTEEYEIKRFRGENQKVFDANMRSMVYEESDGPIIETFGAVAMAAVIYIGGAMVFNHSITSGEFISFLGSIGLTVEPIKKVSKMYLNFQAALGAAVRVFDVLDTRPTVQDCEGAVEIDDVRDGVTFKNVGFRYTDDGPRILDGISFHVPVGQMIAIVGTSGAGKTTLVNLLPRFWDVSEGNILIDGRDLRDVTLVSLRSQMSMVTQDTFLFADSVRANIAYGNIDGDMDRVVRVAKDANAHEFITQLENGYDTPIGELGVKLSGGQRQRLCIARALFKNAPILILDEATSSLDSESEREVQVALERLLQGRTSFVIAHRLSTIQRADRILALKDGKVVEDGRHADLMAHEGEYARLYHLQFDRQVE